jgi:DNA-binding transcriptional LysR family regulator
MSAGSITGAARLTGRSQPAVTRLVQELEAELGYKLLERSGPRISPTQKGVRFHQEAERVLVSLQQMHARATAIGQDAPGPIEIAAISALAAGLVPAALARLQGAHLPGAHLPGALPDELHLHSLSAEQVVQAVLSRRAELGLASLPVDHPGLETHWVGEAPCVAVLPQDDPLAAAPSVPLAALAGRRLLTVANPFRLRRRVEQALAQGGIKPSGIMAMNASLTALLAVRAGLGLAVVEPVTAYGVPVQGVVVRPLDVAIPFLWGVVTPLGQPLAPLVAALIAALREAAAALLPGFRLRDLADRTAIAAAVYGPEPGACA